MLIDVFAKGQGGGAGPIDYLIALDVVDYDNNRNVLRDENGDVIIKRRDPPPDIMRGDPNITRDLINSSPFKWAYVSGVVAFALEDKPTEAQQQDVMEAVEGLAFAGLQPEQYNILWVRHTHEGKVELHFCLPRLELISGKSINPFPPGFEKAFNSLRDVLNKRYGWADPEDPSRARERKNVKESQSRAETRDEIQNWIESQIIAGTINDRSEMIKALQKFGLEVPRTGKNYITVKDPQNKARWRMKGVIFHEGWTRDETIAREIARERTGGGEPPKDLMTSASQSFKKDLDTILNDARNTIKAGIQDLKSEVETELNQERSEKQQHLTRYEEFQKNLSDVQTQIFKEQTTTTEALERLEAQMKRQKMMAAAAILSMPVIFWLLVPTQQDHLQQGKPMSLQLPGRYLIMDIKTGEMANCLMLPTGRQPQCSKVEF